MRKYLISCSLLSAVILLSASSLPAGNNLPRTKIDVKIKGKNHTVIRDYFRSIDVTPDPLDSVAERAILASIPKPYRAGADSMVLSWGPGTKGTVRRMIRALYLQIYPNGIRQILITYTAYSSLYGNKYYDERLGLLTIDSVSSALSMLPFPPACPACPELTRIGFDDTTRVGGNPTVSILVHMSNENPCCPSPDSLIEERTMYFSFANGNASEILSLLKMRREVKHGVRAQDTVMTNDVDNFIQKDERGNIIKIVSTNSLSVDDNPVNQKITYYIWNPKMRRLLMSR